MSNTIDSAAKVNFALDVCDWYSNAGRIAYWTPVEQSDVVHLSVMYFSRAVLEQIKCLARDRGIQVVSWSCEGEFSADRFFTVRIEIVQIRKNGRG